MELKLMCSCRRLYGLVQLLLLLSLSPGDEGVDGFAKRKQLLLVQVIHRHGDRTPKETFPTDPHQESSWAQGWGQLTTLGMQEAFALGKFIRTRYDGFLNSSYDRKEVYVRSTDKDRTLMTAQVELAALFPPTGGQVWNPSLLWQPVPVHTVPLCSDLLLHMGELGCAEYDRIWNETAPPMIAHYNLVYQDLFRFLAEMTDIPGLSFALLDKVYGSLSREKVHNMTLPTWANETVLDTLAELTTIFKMMHFDNDEKAKLKGGFLLGEIVKKMEKKRQITTEAQNPSSNSPPETHGTDSSKSSLSVEKAEEHQKRYKIVDLKNPKRKSFRKLIIYSADNDDTVLALLATLHNLNGVPVPYTGAVFIELYQLEQGDSREDFSVEIFYRNSTIDDPIRLVVPGCPDFTCPLDVFVRVTKDMVIKNKNQWLKDCKVAKLTKTKKCGMDFADSADNEDEIGVRSAHSSQQDQSSGSGRSDSITIVPGVM